MSSWYGRTSALAHPPIARVNHLAASLAAEGRDVINLGQAILGLPPPSQCSDAVRAYLSHDRPHVYSPDPGLPEARAALVDFLRHRKGIGACTSLEQVMFTCGANQAFANVLLAVTCPGDEVITFSPGYFDHDYTIAIAGCRQVPVTMPVVDDRFVFDIAAVEKAVTPATRAIVVVSPGNPTGAVADRGFLLALVELCRARGIWVLSDETYDQLVFAPAEHLSPAALSGFDRVAVLGSFSKILGLAGWRVGYLAGTQELVDQTFKVQDGLVVCAPVPAQLAVLGALPVLDAYCANARLELQLRKQALVEPLRAWGKVNWRHPDGATFGLAEIPDCEDDVAFCERLLQATGIVTVPGSAFGAAGRGHLRISFGNLPVDRIREATARLHAWDLAKH